MSHDRKRSRSRGRVSSLFGLDKVLGTTKSHDDLAGRDVKPAALPSPGKVSRDPSPRSPLPLPTLHASKLRESQSVGDIAGAALYSPYGATAPGSARNFSHPANADCNGSRGSGSKGVSDGDIAPGKRNGSDGAIPSAKEKLVKGHSRVPSVNFDGQARPASSGGPAFPDVPVVVGDPVLNAPRSYSSHSPSQSPSIRGRPSLSPNHELLPPPHLPPPPPPSRTPPSLPTPHGASFADRMASQSASSLGSRASQHLRGRSVSPAPNGTHTLNAADTKSRRRSWMPVRTRNRSGSETRRDGVDGMSIIDSPVFVVDPRGSQPHDVTSLVTAKHVPELWNDRADMLVYLFGRENGPSFKLPISSISASRKLVGFLRRDGAIQSSRSSSLREQAAQGSHHRSVSPASSTSSDLPIEGASHSPPPGHHAVAHLYIPLGLSPFTSILNVGSEQLETLVAIRNLFAFLSGQLLLGTHSHPTIFDQFDIVAGLLQQYEFSNLDGSTYGEVATTSFLGYVRDLKLNDVRGSREKTIEAVVLGERMKCWLLYNEGYVHAVGKWDEILQKESPLFFRISPLTRKRLEKSSMDVVGRLQSVRARLDDFEFPSLFAGVANSSAAAKIVDFKVWRSSFAAMRKHTMQLYKTRYGAWPPKAKSKKNDFGESGLNRILLCELYADFSDLYDMLADRKSLTTRTIEITAHDEQLSPDPAAHHLRALLSEFDRSTPPVRPPIPFDVPNLPSLANTRREFEALTAKKQAKARKCRLDDDEINMALMQSYNRDAVKATPFLEAFMAFERAASHGKSIDELVDMRLGQWIFMYVVLQSLPHVVVDAPDLSFTQGVEYFLCGLPKGSQPWAAEDSQAPQKMFYRVGGGSGVVSLPVDVVDWGVEGIYRRSHCWRVAERWTAGAVGGSVECVSGPTTASASAYGSGGSSSAGTGIGTGGSGGGSVPTSVSGSTPAGPPVPEKDDIAKQDVGADVDAEADATTEVQSSSSAAEILPSSELLLSPPLMGDEGFHPALAAGGGNSPRMNPRHSVALGLEALPVPASEALPTRARRLSKTDPSRSFETFLPPEQAQLPVKKKRWESLGV